MKRFAALAALLAVAFLTRAGSGPVLADPPPPSPWFDIGIDEADPADPTIAPVDDDCPVGLPCKIRSTVAIAPGQPAIPIASVTTAAFLVANDAYVPNGLRVGATGFSTTLAVSTIGPCETNAIPYSSGTALVDATTDPHTTTHALTDLASPDHWP